MGDNYQLRKDVDRLYRLIYNKEEEDLNLLPKSTYNLDKTILDEQLDLIEKRLDLATTRDVVIAILREYELIE